jgi:hypothetical protein
VTLADAGRERLQALQQALAATGLPERGLAQTPQRVAPLPPSRPDLDQLGSELERVQDALAFIDLSAPPATAPCVDAGCAELLAERRELAARLLATQARMQQAVAQWQQSSATLRAQLQPLTSARQALAEQLRPVGRALGPAVDESTQASRAVLAAVQQLQSAIIPAREQAQRAWEQAYRLAYGAPPRPVRPATKQLLSQELNSQMAAAAPARMVAPAIRSHAYEGFSRFDGESSDFGAYTYVLLRSASDLQKPAVRQRFLHLLRSLQTLPSASLVAGGDKPYVNVFCVPVAPGHEGIRDASELVYASDLGQQIKMRAQNGLLTQKTVRQRLTSAPGPFLITVPGRLAQAQTGTPLLMADLSNYPSEAIADLVHQYMNGLVDDFPRQQALWQPPVLQRVALLMIHLAEGTGQLVTSALPTAQAQPR